MSKECKHCNKEFIAKRKNASCCGLECRKLYKLVTMKQWRSLNKSKVKQDRKNWATFNKDKIALGAKRYRENNKEYVRNYRRNYIANNLSEKIAHNLRSRLYDAMMGKVKTGSAIKDLGCTKEQFKSYIESKFKPGMTWDNYGIKGWHIDHIKPLAAFDLTNKEDLLNACHYTNLQPMWWLPNLIKGSKYE